MPRLARCVASMLLLGAAAIAAAACGKSLDSTVAPVAPIPSSPPAPAATGVSTSTAAAATTSAYSADDLAFVHGVLGSDERSDMSVGPFVDKAAKLAPLGERALGLLATFLPDYNLGWAAAETMLVIDRDRAAPIVFRSMPKSDRNVQYHTFKLFIRLLRDGETIGFTQAMHDAAVRCVEADTNADAAEQALLAIGLTGSGADFPLLEAQHRNRHPTGMWRRKLRNAAEAAMARLGHSASLAAIEQPLRIKVTQPLPFAANEKLCDAMERAAFSGRTTFIRPLCGHLDDPVTQRTSDVLPRHPALQAALALEEIVHRKRADRWQDLPEKWKKWCNKPHSGTRSP